MSANFDLTGKVCIVTGAGRGIGRGMAEGLAKHGAQVVLTGRTRATLEDAAAAIGALASIQTADVSKEADVLALRDTVLARFGKIDVLVNNAGVNAIFKGIERTNLEEWQAIIDVNLTGVFLCCKHLGGAMGQGGSIINVSSVAGHSGLLRSVPYCASKGGVSMLTKLTAAEYAAEGIRVNAILPGVFDTGMTQGMPDDYIAGAAKATLMGRIGNASEIASLALFLASDESTFMTDTLIQVDGGYTLV